MVLQKPRNLIETPEIWSGWWFQIFFILTPSWGNDPILTSIFFKWVELKPPSSWNMMVVPKTTFPLGPSKFTHQIWKECLPWKLKEGDEVKRLIFQGSFQGAWREIPPKKIPISSGYLRVRKSHPNPIRERQRKKTMDGYTGPLGKPPILVSWSLQICCTYWVWHPSARVAMKR